MADFKVYRDNLSSVTSDLRNLSQEASHRGPIKADDARFKAIHAQIDTMMSAEGVDQATKDKLTELRKDVEGMQGLAGHGEQATASNKNDWHSLTGDINALIKTLPFNSEADPLGTDADASRAQGIDFHMGGEMAPSEVKNPKEISFTAVVNMQQVAWDLGNDKALSPRIEQALEGHGFNMQQGKPDLTVDAFKKDVVAQLGANGVGAADAQKMVDEFVAKRCGPEVRGDARLPHLGGYGSGTTTNTPPAPAKDPETGKPIELNIRKMGG